RYIRCVKPNPEKKSGRFDGEDVLLQLQYSGTMETIRIRQQVPKISVDGLVFTREGLFLDLARNPFITAPCRNTCMSDANSE
ncbi:unnamed protein product, partial [Laminaria digitata]